MALLSEFKFEGQSAPEPGGAGGINLYCKPCGMFVAWVGNGEVAHAVEVIARHQHTTLVGAVPEAVPSSLEGSAFQADLARKPYSRMNGAFY